MEGQIFMHGYCNCMVTTSTWVLQVDCVGGYSGLTVLYGVTSHFVTLSNPCYYRVLPGTGCDDLQEFP
eukprot:346836-Amorphochlora_amoeboformis.AAC.1